MRCWIQDSIDARRKAEVDDGLRRLREGYAELGMRLGSTEKTVREARRPRSSAHNFVKEARKHRAGTKKLVGTVCEARYIEALAYFARHHGAEGEAEIRASTRPMLTAKKLLRQQGRLGPCPPRLRAVLDRRWLADRINRGQLGP